MNRLVARVVGRILTECAIVAAAALLVVLVLFGINAYLPNATKSGPPQGSTSPSGSLAAVGSQIRLRSVRFEGPKRSLILVSSPSCRFCLASKDFHRNLFKSADNAGVAAYVVIPKRDSAVPYTAQLNLRGNQIMEYADANFSVQGTPTLLLVERSGVVTQMWLGQLNQVQESDVLSRLTQKGKLVGANEAVRTALPTLPDDPPSQLTRKEAIDVIDVRERDVVGVPIFGRLNIPLEEISFRAPYELKQGKLYSVDCAEITDQICDIALTRLTKAGFSANSIGRGNNRSNICSTAAKVR